MTSTTEQRQERADALSAQIAPDDYGYVLGFLTSLMVDGPVTLDDLEKAIRAAESAKTRHANPI
jgi:hypothetical protein